MALKLRVHAQLFKKVIFILSLYMYGCFAHTYVCAPCVYLVPMEAREGV